MKLYRLSQTEKSGYDTHDSMIVCAHNEEDARSIHPYGQAYPSEDWSNYWSTWASNPSQVKCEEIGEANDNQERGVILASYNAG